MNQSAKVRQNSRLRFMSHHESTTYSSYPAYQKNRLIRHPYNYFHNIYTDNHTLIIIFNNHTSSMKSTMIFALLLLAAFSQEQPDPTLLISPIALDSAPQPEVQPIIGVSIKTCLPDYIYTKRGCIKACSHPDFKKCGDFFPLLYNPSFCALKKDGTWISFTFACQACTNRYPDTEFLGVADGACPGDEIIIKPICASDKECPAGQSCDAGTCVNKCAFTTCLTNTKCWLGKCYPLDYCLSDSQCKASQQCQNGKCIGPFVDKCALVKCKAGFVCKFGLCVTEPNPCDKCKSYEICNEGQCLDRCAVMRCIAGTTCIKGQCVPNPLPCKTAEDCGMGQKCTKNVCVDKCSGVVCQRGQICAQGQCYETTCKNVQCPKGTYCKSGKCVPNLLVCGTTKPAVSTKVCTDPRPTDKTCPVLYYIRAPDPLFCGVKSDGSRVNFPRECETCKDPSILYYFNQPCHNLPFLCNPQDQCLGDYCSKPNCQSDQQCPYNWQVCSQNRCVDPCLYSKCANCKYGQCGYQEPNSVCSLGQKCERQEWSCIGFKCVDACARVPCGLGERCRDGQCVKVEA